jgi:hypothetical protein
MSGPQFLSDEAKRQSASINSMMADEMHDMYDRREQRRVIAEAQAKCASWQSSICDNIRAETPKEVQAFIDTFRDSQPAVFDYIRALQTLKYGVWCPTCDRVKSMTGRPAADIAADVASEQEGVDPRVVKKSIPLAERKELTDTFSHNPIIPALMGPMLTPPALTPPAHATAANATAANAPAAITYTQTENTTLPASALAAVMDGVYPPAAKPKPAQPANPFDTIEVRYAAVRELRDDIANKLAKLDSYIAQLEGWVAYKNSNAGNTTQCTDDDIDAMMAQHGLGHFGGMRDDGTSGADDDIGGAGYF